jgi:hypothetical protein
LSKLLSRHAEAIFWMARYVEQAENLARVLDVNETFGRDSRGGQNWRSVLQPYTDEDAFFANHDAATAEAEFHFYLIDQDNPGSIISAELADGSVDRIFARGLHEFLDWTGSCSAPCPSTPPNRLVRRHRLNPPGNRIEPPLVCGRSHIGTAADGTKSVSGTFARMPLKRRFDTSAGTGAVGFLRLALVVEIPVANA